MADAVEVERVDFVSVFTQDIQRAKASSRRGASKDPDGNALLLHRRFDA